MFKKAVLSCLSILCVVVLPMLATFFYQAWLDAGGDNQVLGLFGRAMNWLVVVGSLPAFPWIAGLVVGATIGAWLITIAGAYDRNQPSKADLFQNRSS